MTNWMDTATQWQHGILWPRWAFTPAWGAGEPRFIFYPPLSWLLGGALALLMPVAHGAGCLHLHRHSPPAASPCAASPPSGHPPRCALLAAVFYMVNPYMLFCAYERCAYGELLAAAWMPLLLLAAFCACTSPLRSIAIPVALLWLTNAPSAVMSCYLFALIALLRLALLCRHSFATAACRRWLPSPLRSLGGMALGIGLAAFYIVPAAWERRWVQIELAIAPPMDVASNTLFRHTFDADHDAVLHTASCLALHAARRRRRSSVRRVEAAWPLAHSPHRPLICCSAFSVLASPLRSRRSASSPGCICRASLSAISLETARARSACSAVFCSRSPRAAASFAAGRAPHRCCHSASRDPRPACYRQFNQLCFDEDVPSAQLAAFRAGDGIDPTDEYTPQHRRQRRSQRQRLLRWITDGSRSATVRTPAR